MIIYTDAHKGPPWLLWNVSLFTICSPTKCPTSESSSSPPSLSLFFPLTRLPSIGNIFHSTILSLFSLYKAVQQQSKFHAHIQHASFHIYDIAGYTEGCMVSNSLNTISMTYKHYTNYIISSSIYKIILLALSGTVYAYSLCMCVSVWVTFCARL